MKRMLSTALRSVLLAVALTMGTLIGAAPASADDSTCPGTNVCFWTLQSFQGTRVVRGNAFEGIWAEIDMVKRNYHSVKNHFTNRAVWTRKPGQPAHCTPAGRDDATPPEFTEAFVGGAPSHC